MVGIRVEESTDEPRSVVETELDDFGPTGEGGVIPRTPGALPPAFAPTAEGGVFPRTPGALLPAFAPTAEGGVFPRTPGALLPAFAGFVDFAAAGTETSGDVRCADCGYGAVVHGALPRCPMCGGSVWENRGRRH
jgi:hypothetical protein